MLLDALHFSLGIILFIERDNIVSRVIETASKYYKLENALLHLRIEMCMYLHTKELYMYIYIFFLVY